MSKVAYKPFFMADVRRSAARARFTFASGFAGAGGACLGYELAGGRVVFAIEIDAEAARTYRANFPGAWVEQRDFREVAATPEIIDRLLNQGGLSRGQLDILHASPPCNEYSRLGPGPQEGGNAGLISEVVRMTKVARPRVLIIENVPELAGRYGYILEEALRSLRFDETGRRLYHANSLVLKSSDYGVPQSRRRLFVIAVRADVGEMVGFNSDQDVWRLFPAPTHDEPVDMEAALADLAQTGYELHSYRHAMMTKQSPPPRSAASARPGPIYRTATRGTGRVPLLEKTSWNAPALADLDGKRPAAGRPQRDHASDRAPEALDS